MGGKFNFKIKMVQTDLACREYLFGSGTSGNYGSPEESPIVYQNSSYISKLYFINNYSGGILAKDRIEDMPERYRRFIQPDNPTPDEMIKSFKREMITLANREEVGQNVFYSSLENSPSVSVNVFENSDNFDNPAEFDASALFDGENFPNIFLEGLEGLGEFEETGENEDEDQENYEDYKDDEEIRDILCLNNVFNSEMYKMSKVEYDFSASGSINLTDDGVVNITYDESEMTGFKDSYVQFLFDPKNRDIMTIRRKYFFDVWFTLEKGKRISVERRDRYSGGAIATTSTKELVNNITLEGGDMRIVYTTETDGVPTERVLYSIHAEPAGD